MVIFFNVLFLIVPCKHADLVLDHHQLPSYALAEIELLLQSHGKNMEENYPMKNNLMCP